MLGFVSRDTLCITYRATHKVLLRAISWQAEKLLGRKDTHRKPLLPNFTGSWC